MAMLASWRVGSVLPMLTVAVLAALSLWLKDVSHIADLFDMRGFRHEPGTIIEALRLTSVSRQSSTTQVLTAQRMTHFLDDDTLRLVEPRYDRFQAGGGQMHITARRGLVSEDRDNFYFLDEVRLQREANRGGEPLVLTTEYLRVMLDMDRVRTDKPVQVKQGRSRIDAQGMEADGKSGTMEFAGPVRSVYEK
jgi:lipopolysaccharide export system protein LptC